MKNGLRELFDAFAALKDDPPALWAFYSEQPISIKFVLWDQYPEYRETLRRIEREQEES